MNATSITVGEHEMQCEYSARGRVAMFGLIAAEAAIFTIFVVAYLFYIGKSLTGPMPNEVLSVPIFYTICLLSSSGTIHAAVKALSKGNARGFGAGWLATMTRGAAFGYGPVTEWTRLSC